MKITLKARNTSSAHIGFQSISDLSIDVGASCTCGGDACCCCSTCCI